MQTFWKYWKKGWKVWLMLICVNFAGIFLCAPLMLILIFFKSELWLQYLLFTIEFLIFGPPLFYYIFKLFYKDLAEENLDQATKVAYVKQTPVWAIVVGFVLIAVTIILGILVAIAIPKFTDLNHKEQEEKNKGYLGTMRSAILVYYAENEVYPKNLGALVPKILDEIPSIKLGQSWAGENKNTFRIDPTPNTKITADDIDNSTAWIYNNKNGSIAVNNSGKDSRGISYSEW